jgi:hypothetical protein
VEGTGVTPYEQAKEYLEQGMTADAAREKLVASGVDDASARVVLGSLWTRTEQPAAPEFTPQLDLNPSEMNAHRSTEAAGGGWLNGSVMLGLVLVAIGLGVTFFSYAAASSAGGGTYTVAWGAILVGVIRIVRGLSR